MELNESMGLGFGQSAGDRVVFFGHDGLGTFRESQWLWRPVWAELSKGVTIVATTNSQCEGAKDNKLLQELGAAYAEAI